MSKKIIAACLLGLFSVTLLAGCNCMPEERVERAYPGGK